MNGSRSNNKILRRGEFLYYVRKFGPHRSKKLLAIFPIVPISKITSVSICLTPASLSVLRDHSYITLVQSFSIIQLLLNLMALLMSIILNENFSYLLNICLLFSARLLKNAMICLWCILIRILSLTVTVSASACTNNCQGNSKF